MKLAAIALIGLLAMPWSADQSTYELSFDEHDGELHATLVAEDAPFAEVVLALADRSGLAVEGFSGISRGALVTADLRDRPARDVLARILGSVGVHAERRAGTLVLRPGIQPELEVDGLRDRAMVAYLQALRKYPGHVAAADAIWNRAQIESRRGNWAAARRYYDDLLEQFPTSEFVPRALLESGLLFNEEEQWDAAARRFADVVRLENAPEWEVPARIELANATARLGQFERALHMVEALELAPEVIDRDGRHRLLYVHARALIGIGRPQQALRSLDEADRRRRTASMRLESAELRARAHDALGDRPVASRSWLTYAELVEDPDKRREALRRAAELALEAEDELGVLFIEKLADDEGTTAALAPLAREARVRLALEESELSGGTASQRLLRVERLLKAGLVGEAHDVLTALSASYASFEEPDKQRYLTSYARTFASILDVDTAVDLLSDHVGDLSDPELRRGIYVLAGELYESEDRLDEAIAAYQGRLP